MRFVLPPPPFVPTRAEHVWSYWFARRWLGSASPPPAPPRLDPILWFSPGPPLRRELADHFAGLAARAGAGELDAWADTPRGALGLILLTDAMPRVMFAGTALAGAQLARARRLAARPGLVEELAPAEAVFVHLARLDADDPDEAAAAGAALAGLARGGLARLLREVERTRVTRRASDSCLPSPG